MQLDAHDHLAAWAKLRSRPRPTFISPEGPDAAFLYNALLQGADTEIGMAWFDSSGASHGHALTVAGINYDTEANRGTLQFIDPLNSLDPTQINTHSLPRAA